jgi:hypothetical protein
MPEGMQVPTPGGSMKKMSLEFTDPSEAAAQGPQIPQGAGVPPQGMEAAIPPAGMQPPDLGGMPDQGMGQPPTDDGGMSSLLAGVGQGQQSQMDSGMFDDQQLAQMAIDPTEAQGDQMFDQSMQDPMVQQQLLMAAKRMLGGGAGF